MDTMSVDVAAGRSATSPAEARERARLFLDSLTRPPTRTAEESVVLVVSGDRRVSAPEAGSEFARLVLDRPGWMAPCRPRCAGRRPTPTVRGSARSGCFIM